jgi:Protein of unknown function (DUF1207)
MTLTTSLKYRALFALLALFAMPPALADSDDYLKGYLDALLDLQFPDNTVAVSALRHERGEAVLATHGCTVPEQRKIIENTLIKTERVRAVVWENVYDCEPTAIAATPPAPSQPTPSEQVVVKALPPVALFDPLIADPRQPQFAVRYQYYETPVDNFNAASVSFGDYFPIASGLFGSAGSSQIGLQGAVFALFNLDTSSSDLVNSDYWIGVPVSYRRGRWSFLGRLYHQSSHLGDEFLLGTPGINRINLSYEDLEALASYDWKRWRFYGGGGYIFHSEPDLKPWHSQAGIEYIFPDVIKELDLVAAVDWQTEQERDWRLNRSYQLGLAFRKNDREIRLMLEHFRGFSPNGQFYTEPLRYTGLGAYFDF